MRRAVILAVVLVLAGCQAPAAADGGALGDGDAPADPPRDRIGWENGYWHNESLSVTNEDGLNESERVAVVARAMARVESVRELEFRDSVPVRVIDRATYREQARGEYPASLRRFDNAKFAALFLVGNDEDSIESQEETLGTSVLGYYSPSSDDIVVVSDSETPRLDGEETLAHELVHALQDQHFNLSDGQAHTRDGVQGRNGLVEGEAVVVHRAYNDRCGEEWGCLERLDGGGAGGGGDAHFGIQYMLFFPYSAGPPFVNDVYERGGWGAVGDGHESYPDGAIEVIYPERYPDWEPENVTLPDRSQNGWERVRPSQDGRNRPDYGVVGPSAIAASLAYTLLDDYNDSRVVEPQQVINYAPDGTVDADEPFDYDHPATRGWAGGRFYTYKNGNETGYVWRTTWETQNDAETFASTWRRLIDHWGGDPVGGDRWIVGEESPFTGAYSVRVDGHRVTIVHAPTTDDLGDVHPRS